YFGIQANLPNQIHTEYVNAEDVARTGLFFDQSGFGNVVRHLFGASYGVCNIRVWRVLPIAGPRDDKVQPHFDALPSNNIKLMQFFGDIGPDDGGLQIIGERGEKIVQVMGKNPLILFDSNNLLHTSLAPVSKPRDTIEISIMPRIGAPVYVHS